MEKFCERISLFLLKNEDTNEDEIDEVRFGIELIITQVILFLLLLMIGIYFNIVFETIIFVITLVMLRTFVDGYHADSFYKCMFLTVLFYLSTLYLANLENIYLLVLAVIFAAKVFYCQKNELVQNVKISKIIFLGCLIIMVIIYPLIPLLSMIIGFTLFFTSVSMEVNKYGGKKENCVNGEEGI